MPCSNSNIAAVWRALARWFRREARAQLLIGEDLTHNGVVDGPDHLLRLNLVALPTIGQARIGAVSRLARRHSYA